MNRIRVERVVTDHGYGGGWIVLDRRGRPLSWRSSWAEAFAFADTWARGFGR